MLNFDNMNFKQDDEIDFLPIMPLTENMEDDHFEENLKDEIGILALKNTVLFPGVILPITISRDKSIKTIQDAYASDKIVGVVAQKESSIEEPTAQDLMLKGTIAKILKIIKMPDGVLTVIMQGKCRFEITTISQETPYFKAQFKVLKDTGKNNTATFKALIDSIKDTATKIIQISPNIPVQASLFLKNIDNPTFLIHFIAGNLNGDMNEKQSLLEIDDIEQRASLLLSLLNKEFQFAELKNKVSNKTKIELDKQQKEYYLNQQLKSIKDELGGESNDKEIKEMRKKAETKKWGKHIQETFEKGIEKLERMHTSTPDYSTVYNHLELILDLPWDEYSTNEYDIKKARHALDNYHFGLEKIKDRILEYLAVLKLKGDMKSPILCFVGPPGIGKTSLGKSIAEAIDRKFIKISLGGLHDEAEIRGHRKTYIGAMPGRIIQALRKSKISNPVMLLDEVDKVGTDYKGDASNALLEVLDPEQNANFYDNYLELEYDLSKILFITTANNLQTIQPALKDRLEIIDLSGYALEEKTEIAKKHLIPKQKEAHGLTKINFQIPETTIKTIIEKYTRESGVRELDRHISAIMRNIALNYVSKNEVAKKIDLDILQKILGKERYATDVYQKIIVPGLAIGLAWTPFGGDILFIESTLCEGKGDLKLTGNLGNVMKESASTAYTFLKANYKKYKIDPKIFNEQHVHIHVPEGATPKDGPSAGITILTCLTSLFANKKIKPYLAMTGEITLRGQVLPVGGIKEKILAAKRSGIKEIILCKDNEKDVLDIETSFIKGMKFHFVEKMDEVIHIALGL